MRTTRSNGHAFMAALSIALLKLTLLAGRTDADPFLGPPSVPFVRTRRSQLAQAVSHQEPFEELTLHFLGLRGGSFLDDDASSSAIDVEIDVEEIESSDEEEHEEEEEELDPKLAKATQEAAVKVKEKATKAATQASKAAVSSTLLSLKPKRKSSPSIAKYLKIPYILKACLNPFIFFQMTTEYWRSLIDPSYMENDKDSSQDLRSSLEQKARKGGQSSRRGKRKMRPGQAKTLSDLPQLNT